MLLFLVGAGTGFMLELSKQTPRAVNANAAQEITLRWMCSLQREMASSAIIAGTFLFIIIITWLSQQARRKFASDESWQNHDKHLSYLVAK